VCQICGASDSGFDADYHDFGFVMCPNEHMICEDEAYDVPEDWESDDEDSDIPESSCPICMFEVSSKSDLKEYFRKLYGITEDEILAEIKKNNGRRKRVYDIEYVNYVYEKKGITENAVLAELKAKYGTYANFLKDLRGY